MTLMLSYLLHQLCQSSLHLFLHTVIIRICACFYSAKNEAIGRDIRQEEDDQLL